MTDAPETDETDLPKNEGLRSKVSPVQAAAALTILWALAFFIPILSQRISFENAAPPFFTILTLVLPILFIWLVAITTMAMRRLRAETRDLQRTIKEMHKTIEGELAAQAEERENWTFLQQEQLTKIRDITPGITVDQEPQVRRPFAPFEPRPDPEDVAQYGLPLAHPTPIETVPLTTTETVQALNFPNNSDDKEGLRLMRRASEDRNLALLMKTARQALTSLSQDGVFMDDLVPDAPQPQVWRRFAKGVRGPAIAALGGIRDRSAVALTKGRLKGDIEFRETAHNLLREFDRFVLEFEKIASDDDLLALGQTRSGRLFMLLGRCTGTFERTAAA
ncbi:MAG: hypothetical protein AAFR98_10040 [Pseudomonadota bacterium]